MIRIISIFIFIFLSFGNIGAQNYFSGTISVDTRWMGDVYIDGDVIIPRGVILSIESGSCIFFKPNSDSRKSGKDKKRAELIVEGVLLARGSGQQSPIIFTSEAENAQMNDWYGIVLKNLSEQSVLSNCIVEFAYKGITCYGSSPQISECEIRFNHNSGISCEVRAKPLIKKCVIMGNGFSGINCELAAAPLIAECIITQNTYGVISFSQSNPDLGHFPAEDGQSSGRNRIFNNFEYNIYNHSSTTLFAQNNFWNTNNPDEIRATLFDKANNPAYGEVVFEPIFSQKKKPRLYLPGIVLREEKKKRAPSATGKVALGDTSAAGKSGKDTTRTIAAIKKPKKVEPVVRSTTTPPETIFKARTETVFVYKEAEAPKSQNNIPVMKEPILEAFLDSGKREYIHRAVPDYPGIYRQTGVEGDVLFEVIVDRDGTVADYRVLRSDGELFTEAAIKALKKFRYKPGTFQGKPVKFKIVERFRFKRGRR